MNVIFLIRALWKGYRTLFLPSERCGKDTEHRGKDTERYFCLPDVVERIPSIVVRIPNTVGGLPNVILRFLTSVEFLPIIE